MLELLALILLQLATLFGQPQNQPAPGSTPSAETGGGDWGEGQAKKNGAADTGGGDWGEGQAKKP